MSDHVTPVITGLQDQVNQITGASSKFNADQLAQIRKQFGGGIETEFNRASSTADKNSPVFKQKGLDSLDNYTQYWYDHLRDPKNFTFNDTQPQPDTPQQTADKVTKTATDQTTQLVNTFKDLTSQLTTGIGKTQNDITSLIGGLSSQFQTQQTSLLQGFQDAQAAQSKQMQALVTQMQQTGQAQKRPNYQAALDRNRQLNSGGLSSTMLTGPTGVAPGSMSLGLTSLLGGGK